MADELTPDSLLCRCTRAGQQFVGQWLDSKPQWIQPLHSSSTSTPTAAESQLLDSGLEAASSSTDLVPEEIQELASAARSKAQTVGLVAG